MFPQFIESSRRLLCGSDTRKAAALLRKQNRLVAELRDAFYKDMTKQAKSPDTVLLGTGRNARGKRFPVRVPRERLFGSHAWTCGATGTGKSFLALAVLLQLLRRTDETGLILLDLKGELAGMLLDLWLPVLMMNKEMNADAFLDKLVVVRPFGRHLPELQLLKRDAGIPVEVQAHDVVSLFAASFTDGLGVRQDVILKQVVLLAIDQGLTFPEVRSLLRNPYFLDAAVKRCSLRDVREYFTFRYKAEPESSIHSLLARLDHFLLLPSTRLMLSAENNLDFGGILGEKIAIVDLGDPPLGSEGIARFWGTFLFHKLTRAIFGRRVTKDTKPVVIVGDEWQELLTDQQATQMERILALSRSKRCFLHLINQQPAQIVKVAPSLLKVLATNVNFQLFFRSNIEDAKHFAHAMDVTGCKLKRGTADGPPAFCTPAEELRLLVEEMPGLPDRIFYYYDKRKTYKAQPVYSPTLDVRAAEKRREKTAPDLLRAIERGTLARPIPELEAQLAKRRKREHALQRLEDAGTAASSTAGEAVGVFGGRRVAEKSGEGDVDTKGNRYPDLG